MNGFAVIKVPINEESNSVIKMLLAIPGVTIETKSKAEDGDFISLHEAAEVTGYSYHYIRKLIVEQKKIPFRQPGGVRGKVYVRKSDLIRFIENSKRGRNPKNKVQII